MKFTKMHGLGNDYVYIDGISGNAVEQPSQLAIQMSDRHFGIGGDGIVLILPSSTADARMRMFNTDGSESEMCGNAIRCVGKYLYDHHLLQKETLTIETLAGIKHLTLNIHNHLVKTVRVDMGEPILDSCQIPVLSDSSPVIRKPVEVNGHRYEFTAVSMGNPHCVIFVPEITDAMIFEDGPKLETHPFFPKKTNVEFVKVISGEALQMRVWERGSGQTLACGTGSCATLVAAVLNGFVESSATIRLLGGELQIEWDRSSNHVYMTGPAIEVFEGEWLAKELKYLIDSTERG